MQTVALGPPFDLYMSHQAAGALSDRECLTCKINASYPCTTVPTLDAFHVLLFSGTPENT